MEIFWSSPPRLIVCCWQRGNRGQYKWESTRHKVESRNREKAQGRKERKNEANRARDFWIR